MPNPERATHFLDGVNNFVPDMQYHSDVSTAGITRQYTLSAPVAVDADGIVAAQTVATGLAALTLATTYTTPAAVPSTLETTMGPWGRAVSIVLSGAGTPVIQVRGRDYLGQPMREDITAAGATPVNGKKAFKYIDSIMPATGTATVTLNVGWLDIFGVPFCADALLQENVSDAVTASAGTFVAAVKTDPATATTGDTRGTYAPHANNAANSSRTYRLLFHVDKNKLHGIKQYYA
jgi:hypothetical protein